VNVAVPTFPKLSVTVTTCVPATPDLVVVVPAGIANKNTPVPCSVTSAAGAVVAELVEPTTLPTWTVEIVAPGPKPVTVAVTTVPTGPEVGEIVTVVAPSASVEVAMLPHASVSVNAIPDVIPGRLTVAMELTLLLLRVVGVAVVEPTVTAIGVPANEADSITLE